MLALDVLNEKRAFDIINNTNDYVDAIKIGYPLILSSKLNIIKKIKDISKKEVICDFKLADIPSTNEKIASLALKYGDGIICHGFVGEDSIRAIQRVAKNLETETGHNKKVIMVVEMSHHGALRFMTSISDELAEMAKKLNVDAIVAPSTRPKRLQYIKNIVENIPIISPGIGAQGGNIDEVLRILGERDYIIVGRGIYESKNPREEAHKYYKLFNYKK